MASPLWQQKKKNPWTFTERFSDNPSHPSRRPEEVAAQREFESRLREKNARLVQELRRTGHQVLVCRKNNGGFAVLPTVRWIDGYIAFTVR
jgi:hypothetical protein